MNKIVMPLILVSIFLAGCDPKDETPTHLVYGLHSYSSILSVKQAIESRGCKWNVLKKTSLEPGDQRPRFDLLTAETDCFLKKYTDSVTLTFYNDRLMSVTVYPNDWSKYKIVLAKDIGKDVSVGSSKTLSKYTKILVHRDWKERIYAKWEDTRLASDVTSWIRKYA